MNNEQRYITIPIPIHPDDKDLPGSSIWLKLPSGKLVGLNIPIQGAKTIETLLTILELWKPTIVLPEPPEVATPGTDLEASDLLAAGSGLTAQANASTRTGAEAPSTSSDNVAHQPPNELEKGKL